jgi:hypothetical protein
MDQDSKRFSAEMTAGRAERRLIMQDIRSIHRQTMTYFAQMEKDIAGIKHILATKVATRTDFALLRSRVDSHTHPQA